jgi:hypothetical protein
LATYVIFKKTAKSKESPKRQNFALSGHPVKDLCRMAGKKMTCKLRLSHRREIHFMALSAKQKTTAIFWQTSSVTRNVLEN